MIKYLHATLLFSLAAILALCALSAVAGLKPLGFFWALVVLVAAFVMGVLFLKLSPLWSRLANKSTVDILVFLCIIGLGPRLLCVYGCHNKQVSDFKIIHELAVALVTGKGFSYTGTEGFAGDCALFLNRPHQQSALPTMFRPPGAALLLASEYFFTGVSFTAGKVLYALMGCAIGICIFFILCPLSRIAALIAAVIWDIFPGLWGYSLLLGTEIPFTLLLCLSAMLLQKSFACQSAYPRTWLYLAFCGVCAGLSCLVKPQTHHILCCIVVIFIISKSLSLSLKKILVFSVACAVPLIIWSTYNYHRFTLFRFQTTEVGVALFARSQYIQPDHEKSLDSLRQIMGRSTDEISLDKTGRTIAFRRLWIALTKENFIKIMWENHHKVWRNDNESITWAIEEAPGYAHFWKWKSALPVTKKTRAFFEAGLHVGYIALIFLALISVFRINTRVFVHYPGILILAANFVLSSVAFFLFQGTNRYHVALMPFLMILIGLLNKAPQVRQG